MSEVSRKKYAIYDPDAKLFVSKECRGVMMFDHEWTMKLDDIKVNVEPDQQTLRAVKQGGTCGAITYPPRPNVHFVEVTVTYSWEEAEFKPVVVPVETTKKYIAARAVYEQFLPAFRSDPDDIPDKDWKKFKDARLYLRETGVEVE